MQYIKLENLVLDVDFEKGCIKALNCYGVNLTESELPLFRIRMMNDAGEFFCINTFDAKKCTVHEKKAVYYEFPYDVEVTVEIDACFSLGINVENHTDMLIEWIDFPVVSLKPLRKNGGNATMLFPKCEGALIEDAVARQDTGFADCVPEYPSTCFYSVFPNMVCSQFMCYLFEGKGFYMGAHDKDRGLKGVHFGPSNDGIEMYFKIYCGKDFKDNYKLDFPIVLQGFEGDWYEGADIYKAWFENNLPENVKKIYENKELPEWYEQSPLVITYPIRGVHDMDKMEPNALFPYTNALPLIDEIADKVKSKLMVLLMHWEGTAPWAPPYVWPPYGGEDLLHSFADALHERGHVLGVYCSGFGYTLQSNLIEAYNQAESIKKDDLLEAMCASPAGKAELSNICVEQRSGYDLCLGSEKALKILEDAYTPLFESKVDYVQILDQNHGGGQYFCYSREHNHVPAPGKWMTLEMNKLLKSWKEKGGKKLFGCESAAAEPFMGNLAFSDNRYELNWHVGKPVPLYAYLYHEYVRNFMGNQVACGLKTSEDTLCLRLAYSFTAGDCMTLVVTPDGRFMSNWGNHDFGIMPNRENALQFITNMQKFFKDSAKEYLYGGKMIRTCDYKCECSKYSTENGRLLEIENVFSTAWETKGKQTQIFVNHTSKEQEVKFRGKTITIPAFDAVIEALN